VAIAREPGTDFGRSDAPLTGDRRASSNPGLHYGPEAERGDEVDARADQYSLCVSLMAPLRARAAALDLADSRSRSRSGSGPALPVDDDLGRRLEGRPSHQARWLIRP